MADWLDLLEYLGNAAVLVDEKARALDAHVLAAEHALLFPHAVRFGDFMVDVAQQREIQLVLCFELRLLRGRVGRDAEHDGVLPGELFLCVAKLARFQRSARCIGFGKEEKNDVFTADTREVEVVAGIGLQMNGRRGVAGFQHVHSVQRAAAVRPIVRCSHESDIKITTAAAG